MSVAGGMVIEEEINNGPKLPTNDDKAARGFHSDGIIVQENDGRVGHARRGADRSRCGCGPAMSSTRTDSRDYIVGVREVVVEDAGAYRFVRRKGLLARTRCRLSTNPSEPND